MKQIIGLYTLLVASCLLTGCNSDEDVGGKAAPVAVQFGSGIVQTKTTNDGNQWTLNDPIGIFMLKNGQPLNSSYITEDADNVEYKAQTGGNAISGFTPVSGTPIFYPQNGDKVDFIAYYPYKSSLTNYIYPVDVSNQTSPANIDVLYANTANTTSGGYNKNSGTVDLRFNHALSKLSFTLISGTGSPNLTGAKIEITNLATTASVSLSNGSVTETNSGQTLIANTATDGLNSSAIVIPQTLSGNKLVVTLTDNASKFEWNFPANTELQIGKNHQYNITVGKTGITVSSSGITSWTGTGDPATQGTIQKGYKVGDYYPDPTAIYQNGVLISGMPAVGVVFWLSNQGTGNHPYDKVSVHGKIVGLYERAEVSLDGTWVTNYGIAYNAGTGWYTPLSVDMDYLYCAYNGMNYETWGEDYPSNRNRNDSAQTWFNTKITDAGGDNITGSLYYGSPKSDEWGNPTPGGGFVYYIYFSSGSKFFLLWSGNNAKMRVIKDF